MTFTARAASLRKGSSTTPPSLPFEHGESSISFTCLEFRPRFNRGQSSSTKKVKKNPKSEKWSLEKWDDIKDAEIWG